METLMAIGRFVGIVALGLEKRGEGGNAAMWLKYLASGIRTFADNPGKLEAINQLMEQKVRDQEDFTPAEFEAMIGETDELTDRADAAARDRGLETSSELSPVGDLNVNEAIQSIAATEDQDVLRAIVEHDGRKGAREAAQARLDALVAPE